MRFGIGHRRIAESRLLLGALKVNLVTHVAIAGPRRDVVALQFAT